MFVIRSHRIAHCCNDNNNNAQWTWLLHCEGSSTNEKWKPEKKEGLRAWVIAHNNMLASAGPFSLAG